MGKAKKYPNEKVELEDSDYVQTESDEESSSMEMDVSDSGDEDIVSNLFFFLLFKIALNNIY